MAAVDVEQIRQAGWVEPVKYDYDTYNADRKDLEATEGQSDLPSWAANATKYEWSDEYGDVGPAHPELEKMLFRDEFHVTEGEERQK